MHGHFERLLLAEYSVQRKNSHPFYVVRVLRLCR